MRPTIFIESSEEQGILYNRYHTIPTKIDSFIKEIGNAIAAVNKEGVDDAKEISKKLLDKLDEFKKSIDLNIKKPDPVEVDELKDTKKKIKACREYVEELIGKLGKLRKQAKWGTNWIDGILFRSKILHHSMESEMQDKTNEVVRAITRSLDWAEWVTLDLLNLTSQDLNILTLVDKVYYRNIFENNELDINLEDPVYESIDDVLASDINDDEYVSIFEDEDISSEPDIENQEPVENNTEEDNNENDLGDVDNDEMLDMPIDDKSGEEYYPVYCITTAGDPDYEDPNKSKEVRGSKGIAKLINNITLGETHTHASIAFDPNLKRCYSFDLLGFKIEDFQTMKTGTINIARDIYVAVTFLTKQEMENVKEGIRDYINTGDDSNYNVKQFINQIFGKTQHLTHSQICSTFVGYLMNVANPKYIHRDYSMIRPEDITLFPRSFHVISFKNQQDLCNRISEVPKRTKEIYDANIDEIREYNNELPKILIKHDMKQYKTIDKIFNSLLRAFRK